MWGGALILGAVITFVVASLGRQRLSGKHPEQYLAVWQRKAESRATNPIIYLGRQLEFIIRRCFMPYAILAFALMNLIQVPVCVGVIAPTSPGWCPFTHIAFSHRHPRIHNRLCARQCKPNEPGNMVRSLF